MTERIKDFEIEIMFKEYEMLNSKVAIYQKRVFRIFLGLGAGTMGFAYYGLTKPSSVNAVSLLCTILLHGATITLIHSYLVILVFKRAMRVIADRINRNSSEALLVYEGNIYLGLWGGVENVNTPLTWLMLFVMAVPLCAAYLILVPKGFYYLKACFPNTSLPAIFYVALMLIFLILEIIAPSFLRDKLMKPFIRQHA
jgi:hypothetical protein